MSNLSMLRGWEKQTITIKTNNHTYNGIFSEVHPEYNDYYIVLDKGLSSETRISINAIEAISKNF